jgi:hypothetical protein
MACPRTAMGAVLVSAGLFGMTGAGLGALLGSEIATIAGLLLYLYVAEPAVSHIAAFQVLDRVPARGGRRRPDLGRPDRGPPLPRDTAAARPAAPAFTTGRRQAGPAWRPGAPSGTCCGRIRRV